MKYNQQVVLKHDHGITAQWIADDWSWMAIATYFQLDKEGTKADGTKVVYKKWVLGNCSGPWTGVSEDGKSLTVLSGFEAERNQVSGEANLLLSLFNATIGGKKAFSNVWTAASIGLDDGFWPEDREEKE